MNWQEWFKSLDDNQTGICGIRSDSALYKFDIELVYQMFKQRMIEEKQSEI